jgi:hypothetical protein
MKRSNQPAFVLAKLFELEGVVQNLTERVGQRRTASPTRASASPARLLERVSMKTCGRH